MLADGIPDEAIRVVFSGLEFGTDDAAAAGKALRQSLGIPDDAFVLAHAAALTSEKRQSDILRAVAQVEEMLRGSSGSGVHLLIAGSGELAPALAAKARQLGIKQRVHFL